MRLARLILALTVLPLLGSCGFLGSLVQKPTVSFQRLDVKDVSFSAISVNFVFAVNNPNDIGVDLASFGYQITVDAHPFVQGSTNQPLHVPARGVGQATLPLTIQYVELGRALQSLFTRVNVPYTLATTLGFNTPIGVLTIPLSTSGNMPVPQIPTLQFANAGMSNVGISGADLGMVVNVRNTNAYAVPLGNLAYAVKLANTPIVSSMKPLPKAAPTSTTPVQIGAHVDFLSAGLGIARAIQGGGAELAFDGTLDLGPLKLPVHLARKL